MSFPITASPLNRYNEEQKLIYLSALQTIPENSRFIYRLSLASAKMLSVKKRGREFYNGIDHLLVNGNLNEDPQEQMFVTVVNTPRGYYRVFQGLYTIQPNILSRLLYTAENNGLNDSMCLVYALLEICDTMVDRSGCARYVAGNDEAERPTGFTWYDYDVAKARVIFTTAELAEIFVRNGCNEADWQRYLITAKPKEIENELNYKGHSDLYELNPLYTMRDGKVLVLQPSAVMLSAYTECKRLYTESAGKKAMLVDYYTHLVECVEDILMSQGGGLQIYHALIDNNIYNTAYQFDSECVANIVIYLHGVSRNEDAALLAGESNLKQMHPKCEVFNIVIYDSLSDDFFGFTSKRTDLPLHVDDLEVILNRRDTNLRTLWYYALARKKMRFPPMSQELDIMSIYFERKQTFYFDKHVDILMPEFGSGFTLRKEHYLKYDCHVVNFDGEQLMLVHDNDVPQHLPYYREAYTDDVYVLELGDNKVKTVVTGEDGGLKDIQLTVYHALAYWMYILWREGLLRTTSESVTIENIPQLKVDVEELDVIREMLVMLLRDNNIEVNVEDALAFIKNTGIHYLQLNDSTDLLLLIDGVKESYEMNDNMVDVVLDEIANLLGKKDGEKKLTKEESKAKTIEILQYLGNEAKNIIQQFDCELLIESMLKLTHSMMFWERQTKYRYEGLSAAFQYLGDSIESQIMDANRYTEVDLLARSIIEYVVFNNFQTPAMPEMNVKAMDRLFALVHHVVGFGNYYDMLISEVDDCELTVLENGRVELPVAQIDKSNSYMRAIYDQSMVKKSLLNKMHALLPNYSIDVNSDEFQQAYLAEFGIEHRRYIQFISDVLDSFYKKGNPLFTMTLEDFRQTFFKDLGEEEFKRFSDKFFLSAQCVQGHKPSEFFLQRQNRAVQLSTRPIILYNSKVYFSTKTLTYREQVIMDRINAAKTVAESQQMKEYVAEVSNIKGHQFVEHVADYFRSLNDANLNVFSEVSIKLRKLLDADKDYGDIDILLVDTARRMIVCIEAKNYAESHTTYEVLMQYRKAKKEVIKAEQRDVWCKKNVAQFSKVCKECDENYKVKTIFLTYYESVMKHLQNENISSVRHLSALDIVKNPSCVFE